MLLDFAIITLGLTTLILSANYFVKGAAAIAQHAGMPPLLIGMTIVSAGTSAPEILVSLMSAFTGSGTLAIGNALGSNITNIGLVLGVTLIISPITIGRSTAFTDLPLLLIIVIFCMFLLHDGELGFWDSITLLIGFTLFIIRIISHTHKPDIGDEEPDILSMALGPALLTFFSGLVILIASSRILVYSAINVAESLGVSELLIGLTIVAVGTSLPELAASVVSAIRGHADIAIGAIVGSNIFNLLIVLSLPGLPGNLVMNKYDILRDLGTVFLTTVLLSIFTWVNWQRKNQHARLGRLTGGVLLVTYIMYYMWLFMFSTTV